MNRRHRKLQTHTPGQDRWLVTYSDLITLLMIFFIVMYSMSQLDAKKFRAIADSLSVTLGGAASSELDLSTSSVGPSVIEGGKASNPGLPGQVSPNSSEPTSLPANEPADSSPNTQEDLTIEGIKTKLDQFAKENGISGKLNSSIEERGLVISIQDTLLFSSGSADITPKASNILKKISSVLDASPNYIRVEGHTCNLPIHNANFPSNWELSVIRATNVVQLMAKEGGISPLRLSAVGYGEYRPVADNNTKQGRIANRRVDLVILRSKYDVLEPGRYSTE
ncbi:OmpA family protein [Dehalobacter sp. DCM]|uniref:flagellar motor protein MotB n=1 Tax=Dehalobacter sp. DCM TaxID=2907827 RepID=UPI003081956E|nr:OmpA family protein [Dehalobacter sp. DCM]